MMVPLMIGIVVGGVASALFFWVLRARVLKAHRAEVRRLDAVVTGLQRELGEARADASAVSEPENAPEPALPPDLKARADGLGLRYSPIASANTLRAIQKELKPAFGYYDKALNRPASCGRCGAEDFRFIYAGGSKAFEGCLGCYCFTCGYGISSNRTLNKRLPEEELGDLFALFRRWESQAADPAQTPVEANVASAGLPPVPVEPAPKLEAPAGTPSAT